ncbi:hypothetical protein [Cohnella cholangitidis]|uniref:Uncharacterized protein n=1 Tax=Cohnella cholangitidis TaxID=2598458 RepID=A0A7G5C5G9_9BACL|nr:hypothetical protein [Cohnella cholangitidis]QMV44453.1 hypothetical protein FPL14_27260 [Cohnella cholangitidis]
MKTRDDFLQLLQSSADLSAMVRNSEIVNRDYMPRNTRRTKRTSASIARDHFWDSVEGAAFRHAIGMKTGVELGDVKIRAAIKDALLLFISRIKD